MASVQTAHSPDSGHQAFVGRQPVFDRQGDIHAYELLFRQGPANFADVCDGTQASASVLHVTLMEIGLEAIVGTKISFINFNRDLLLSDIPDILPANKVVLEILEDVEIDQQLIDCVRKLKDKGFTIALDDFQYHPKWLPLLELANIIKIDVLELSPEQVHEHLELLRPYPVKLLAEKVETQADYERLYRDGFDYFQGYFFARPAVVSGKQLASNELALLQLISKLQNPHSEILDIEQLVEQDVSLSYKLLRFINSAAFGLPEKINSLHRAIIFFGLSHLRNWASLIAMASNKKHSSELLRTAAVRAKFCESLSQVDHSSMAGSYFMVGLFSVLDALLDQPMSNIVEHLPLEDDIKAALINQQGDVGAALRCALACERCHMQDIHFAGIDPAAIYAIHLESMLWAEKLIS